MPVAPDLAVEVVSPSDRDARVTQNAITYLDAGTRLVWVVEPDSQTVTVYTPDLTARILRAEDTLDGGDVLPGFTLKVAEIFE
jgi:Uma2 family endonuclease